MAGSPRRHPSPSFLLRLLPALLALLLTAPLMADDAVDQRLRKLAAGAGQGNPLMRIGLEPGETIKVSPTRRFKLMDPATGNAVWRGKFSG